MQALLLVVYIKKEDLLCATHVESEISRAGMGGWWVGVPLYFFLIIIIHSHLNIDYLGKIIHELPFSFSVFTNNRN